MQPCARDQLYKFNWRGNLTFHSSSTNNLKNFVNFCLNSRNNMSILLADIDATCAALGYSDGERYQAEVDAVQGLKHLIWILRRDLDNHEYRRHLGHAKVLQTDLVYMHDYIQDEEFADVLIRLLIILTNPILLLYREGPPRDNHGRKVFLELIDILQGYKTAFTKDKIWSALFGKMQKSLEIDWALRSEEQSLLIERILVLIRNVLQVPANPEAECRADNDASVHDQVIWALHQSGILDLVLFIVSSPDEHQFHLHCLEILCLLYREQTAESLADASLQRSVAEKQRDEQELIAARRREKQRLMIKPPSGRHSRFGGTYVIRNLKSVSDRDIICHQPLERVSAIDFDREKQRQKRPFRHIKEEAQFTRRSAFSVRLCLREYCIEVLRSAYNTLVRQVRRVLERNAGSKTHDDSYLLWAIRFFMEFNRLSGLQLQLVSESLSVQCFHWVLTRMQRDMDMIVCEKRQARPWAKRLHVGLLTFRELLQSMLALQKLEDDNALALFDMLLNNVCYVLEYRETILYLLMNYNEAHSTKAYLRDVVETANIFIKMMEKFCKNSVVVQDRKRGKKRSGNKKPPAQQERTKEEIQEELENKWTEYAGTISSLLTNGTELPEENQPLPFDATSEKSIDDQKEDCMKRINYFLREEELEKAVALLRSAREVWPENDIFGAITAAPEDELLLLREIFLHNISTAEKSNDANTVEPNDDSDNEEYEDMEDNMMVEKTFKFDDFIKRLLNPKIVRACTIVLTDWDSISTKSLRAAVTILHRIAYGCSCPGMLYQANLFLIFQKVFNAARDAHHEELRRLGVYVVKKFVEVAPSNPKIYAELLFYKTIKEANELETGYCDAYESGTKAAWTEDQEMELRLLFEENQRNPATDKDVIDWILENLIDKKRSRRGVLKKLKELGLMFKAPTKKSTAAGVSKNVWQPEEDEELRSLYDMYRLEEDCLDRIIREFVDRRNKQQIIKRLLQLHIIADKSEILPPKQRKRKSKKQKQPETSDDENNSDVEVDNLEEPHFGEEISENIPSSSSKKKPKSKKQRKEKPQKIAKRRKHKIKRTALDVGTIRTLLDQIDSEKFQAALDWLKNSLNDAAEEEKAPIQEEDAKTLVPLTGDHIDAMEDADFKKLLIAMSMQPPLMGSGTYWRIPIHLNAADLKTRARLIAGEGIEIENVDENVDEDDKDESDESNEFDNVDNTPDDEDGKEDGIDMFAKHRERLNILLYSKSDEEDEIRQPIMKESKVAKRKQKEKKSKKSKITNEDDEEELKEIDEIKQKLDKRKRHSHISSEDEVEEGEKVKKVVSKTPIDFNGINDNESGTTKGNRKKNEKKKQKVTENAKELANNQPTVDTDALFNQLRAQRKKKQKEVFKPLDTKTQNGSKNGDNNDDGGTDDVDDLLDFNSEDYRKRLLELGDSDADEMEVEINSEGISEEKDKENASKSNKPRTRRINIIDSDDSDEDNDNNDSVVKQKNVKDGVDVNVDDVDKTSHQMQAIDDIDVDGKVGVEITKKRRRSMNTTTNDNENDDQSVNEGAMNVASESDTGAALIKRKKFAIAQLDDSDSDVDADVDDFTKRSVKSRRLAIVDDDE